MTLGLGLDAGGGGTRWVLAEPGGAIVARGEAPPLSGHVFSAEAGARAWQLIAGLAAAIRLQWRAACGARRHHRHHQRLAGCRHPGWADRPGHGASGGACDSDG